jgi:hypothetical protein
MQQILFANTGKSLTHLDKNERNQVEINEIGKEIANVGGN